MNDFLRNSNGDLLIQNGDLVVDDATKQHQADIVRMWKGWNHFAPTVGVGLERWLNDSANAVGLTGTIRNELERDGQTVDAVRLTPTNILIEARYE
jgi:hypothetical protein